MQIQENNFFRHIDDPDARGHKYAKIRTVIKIPRNGGGKEVACFNPS